MSDETKPALAVGQQWLKNDRSGWMLTLDWVSEDGLVASGMLSNTRRTYWTQRETEDVHRHFTLVSKPE